MTKPLGEATLRRSSSTSGWTRELGLASAMQAYFVENRSGYGFPHAISIFRNLAWRLLILELWARAYKVSPHAA